MHFIWYLNNAGGGVQVSKNFYTHICFTLIVIPDR